MLDKIYLFVYNACRTKFVLYPKGREMTHIIAVLVCCSFVFVIPTAAAKGGGGCGGDLKCEQQRIERQKLGDRQAAERATEEKKETEAQATSLLIEQVKVFPYYGTEYSYSNPYFRTEQAINAWLRGNPQIKIIRVVPVSVRDGGPVLVFYRR